MEFKKWHERENNCIKKIVYKGDVQMELEYESAIINMSINDLAKIFGHMSIAHIRIVNTYYHLFVNGDTEDSYLEIVEADEDCNEISFSEPIYDVLVNENQLVDLLFNYFKA